MENKITVDLNSRSTFVSERVAHLMLPNGADGAYLGTGTVIALRQITAVGTTWVALSGGLVLSLDPYDAHRLNQAWTAVVD